MRQYINLYDVSLRPSREFLTLSNLAIALGVTLLLLVGLASYGMVRSSNERNNLQTVEARLRQAQEELTVFAARQAARRQDPALAAELENVRRQIHNKQDVLTRLASGEFGGQAGFSPIYRDLASVAVDGLWLTRIDVLAAGQAMALHGRMLNEAKLPSYVQALGRLPALNGRVFSALNVNRVEAKMAEVKSGDAAASTANAPAYVEFVLNGLPAESVAEVKR